MSKKANKPLSISGIAGSIVKFFDPLVPKKIIGKISGLSSTRKAILSTLAVVIVLGLGYLVFSLVYIGKVYPNVMVGSANFGGLKTGDVLPKLTTLSQANTTSPITLTFADHNYTLSPSDVNYQADLDQTATAITGVGRQNGWWRSLLDQLKAPFVNTDITPVASYDHNLLDQQITSIAQAIDVPAQDASAKFVSDQLTITQEKVGQVLNQPEIKNTIIEEWNNFNPAPIALNQVTQSPKVIADTKDNLQAQVDQLSQAKLTLTWSNGKKVFATKDIRSLIGFAGGDQSNSQGQALLAAQFTSGSISNYLDSFATAQNIDQPAQDPKLVITNGALAVSQASKKGNIVDRDASADLILNALNGNSDQAVALVMKDELPVITEDKLDQLGIKQLIGTGTTSFSGSPANRIANIANGVRLMHSALIAPGAEFSTVKTLGAVDGTTGFLPELVIKEDRTVPEFGGGLCQVSTTLFRSVMNAGLKVTERTNHSYRVSYYEPPIGLDATIYLPKPDFKFVNDTPGYILIQGRIVGNKITFELWGTSDGRTSTISDPVVSNYTNPPDPLYTNSDTMYVGQTRQTEKPHQGATAIAYYTVTRNGVVINKQTFKSVYKALPAQFLVGTKPLPVDPNAPPA